MLYKVSLSLFKSSEGVWASAQSAVNECVSLEFYMNNLEKHRAVNTAPQARHLKYSYIKLKDITSRLMLACQLATKDKVMLASYE